jgi:hypothetical protein
MPVGGLFPRLRDVLVSYAEKAIDLAPAEVFLRYKGEDRPASPRWQCDVIRFEDAVDEAGSKLNWLVDYPLYDPVGSKYSFKSDLPPDLHLFRLWKAPNTITCSQALHDALVAAKLSGIVFEKL